MPEDKDGNRIGGRQRIAKHKEFRVVKIVETKKDHSCAVCEQPILKGTKCLNEHGFSKDGGYWSCYFHLDHVNRCYLDFMEATGSDGEEAKLILSAAEELRQKVALEEGC
jgi:hypothetical protein